ncbi:hypothetical protein [Alkalibacterium pelagium]|uniref:Uncharacterized protein n=1 Tax=Alkalibacterium pelagium TaxID=426702 RepID=A0A1H7IGF1_9LACT|nr:hypothetical protein [Alkalibacterium pelagium]GEN50079.1 hypothetical protein APE02nite_07440 [Alkalibacterium pelagium]SEK61576.1 hypothetical protein SAMN04488099_104126 [Alkalibacterium pelagium]
MEEQNLAARDLLDATLIKKDYATVLLSVLGDDLEKIKQLSKEKKYGELAYSVDTLIGKRHDALINLIHENLNEIDELATEAQEVLGRE